MTLFQLLARQNPFYVLPVYMWAPHLGRRNQRRKIDIRNNKVPGTCIVAVLHKKNRNFEWFTAV